MTIIARLRALEQQATAWAAEDDVDADDEIAAIAEKLAGAAALPLLGAPVHGFERLDWVLDALGAPRSQPGTDARPDPVQLSRAERLAALLGMSSKELDAELERRVNAA